MGEVYLAEACRGCPAGRFEECYLPMSSADPDSRAQFRREADLASKLWHPKL